MNAATIEFAHKGQGWIATLDGVNEETGTARLTVRPDCYEDDPGAGSGIARSAFFKACEILKLAPADSEESHSGGFFSRLVMPEIVAEDDAE